MYIYTYIPYTVQYIYTPGVAGAQGAQIRERCGPDDTPPPPHKKAHYYTRVINLIISFLLYQQNNNQNFEILIKDRV